MSRYSTTKGPYEVLCKCGNKFCVSHSVKHRLLNCPKCMRSIYYERDRKGKVRESVPVGRFQSKKEFERRLQDVANKSLYSEQDVTED